MTACSDFITTGSSLTSKGVLPFPFTRHLPMSSSSRRVLAHGVFDLFHSGHIAHLLQAKAFGTHLTVSVLADAFFKKKRKLIQHQAERAFCVASLRCVDAVLICNAEGPTEILKDLQPDIYVRNDEYFQQTAPEYALCRELGIQVGFTRTMPPHTSDLINQIIQTRSKR